VGALDLVGVAEHIGAGIEDNDAGVKSLYPLDQPGEASRRLQLSAVVDGDESGVLGRQRPNPEVRQDWVAFGDL
jgi:hypothetical protein